MSKFGLVSYLYREYASILELFVMNVESQFMINRKPCSIYNLYFTQPAEPER